MTASSPSAVFHRSCLPSSNSATKEASVSNVGPSYSSFGRSSSLSSRGCALPLSSAVANSSCFHIPHRRRKHCTKTFFVVKGSSSNFEVDEERKRHGLQIPESSREREESIRKGRVSWSPEGKATILWATRKQQDKASPSSEKRQSSDFGSQHGPPVPPVSEYKKPFPLKNQHRAVRPAHTVSRRSSSHTRQQTELSDPSFTSSFPIGSSAFQQATEPDALGTPTLSVQGAETFLTRNDYSWFNGAGTHEAPPSEESTPQSGSSITSRLEEILNNFRTRQRREEVWRDLKTRQKRRDDSFEEGGAAAADRFSSTSEVTRRESNLNSSQAIDTRKYTRKDNLSSIHEGVIHKTSLEDEAPNENSFANTEDYGRSTHGGERNSTMVQQKTGGINSDGYSLDFVNSSPATPSRVERGHSPASQMHASVSKGSSTFVERRGAKSGRLQYNSRYSGFESKARGRGTDIEKPFVRGRRTGRQYTSRLSQSSHAQNPVGCKLDVDAEDNIDDVSPFTSDSELDGSYSTQSENVEEQMQACLIKNGKASWHSHPIPSLPFELQYSYSETPKAPIIRYREDPHSPFGPETLARPWTGGPPKKKSKKNLPLFDSFNPPPRGRKGVRYVQQPGPYPEGQGPKPARSKEEILGEPLTTEEIAQMVDSCRTDKRQLNLGRDGLTHNMLDLIHCHWKRRRVIKVRCLGVPTVDMDNVCFHLEDKTGGKIIFRAGGVVYLFRGRNYNYRDRPQIPLMLWKPPTPVYPKLVKRVPEGLTEKEANRLRLLGKKVEPLCTLGKNGVYLNLVNDVRAAFKVDKLVRIVCTGLNPSDYKKIGAKLKDLVPCVLLSFHDEQILMWKGKETPTENGSLGGGEGTEGVIEESSVSPVESASFDMSDLKAKVYSDVSSAQNDEPCSDIEEKQLPSPTPLEGFSSHASPNATVVVDRSLATSSLSLVNGHTSVVTAATAQVIPPELVKNGSSLEELSESDPNDVNEVDSSLGMVLAAQDELSLDEPNIVIQATLLRSASGTILSGDEEASLLTKDQEREVVVSKAALESRSARKGSAENVGAAEKERLYSAPVVVSVDNLWDEAIASGIAIQLDDVDMDGDIVVKKASQLANVAPVGEEYTRKLMKTLQLRTPKVVKPDSAVHTQIKKLRRMRLEKKLLKRPFRVRTADEPKDIRQDDGMQNGGMSVDELAQLLSIR